MLRRCHGIFPLFILLSISLASCTSARSKPIPLTAFTENYVDVSISLEQDSQGQSLLSATFTPPAGYHLYSKDIPIAGIDGLGRPTLLELTASSALEAAGALIESVEAETPDFGPRELLVYPAGAVTLLLPVDLPPGEGWIEDEVQVTYMACSASQCKPPVVAKHVLIAVPGTGMLDSE